MIRKHTDFEENKNFCNFSLQIQHVYKHLHDPRKPGNASLKVPELQPDPRQTNPNKMKKANGFYLPSP